MRQTMTCSCGAVFDNQRDPEDILHLAVGAALGLQLSGAESELEESIPLKAKLASALSVFFGRGLLGILRLVLIGPFIGLFRWLIGNRSGGSSIDKLIGGQAKIHLAVTLAEQADSQVMDKYAYWMNNHNCPNTRGGRQTTGFSAEDVNETSADTLVADSNDDEYVDDDE